MIQNKGKQKNHNSKIIKENIHNNSDERDQIVNMQKYKRININKRRPKL